MCASCGEFFSNENNFDLHRKGKGKSRFCVDPSTLVSKSGENLLKIRHTDSGESFWVGEGSRPDAL